MSPTNIFQHIGMILYFITTISIVLVVISENRNPIRTLAWVLVLLFLPVFGVILFYLFGQNNRKKRSVSSLYHKGQVTSTSPHMPGSPGTPTLQCFASLSALLLNTNNATLFHGSKVEVITSGSFKFERLLSDMASATHHIHLEYFLFHHDTIGQKVKEMLMKRAADGLEVRLLYDNVANIGVPSRFYKEMEESGVQVSPFMKINKPTFHSRVNYRNHRKVVVIDGQIGYIGGMNIGDDYALNPLWRDTHLRIQGVGVSGLQTHFFKDWHSSGEESLTPGPSYFPTLKRLTDNLLQIVTGGPNTEWSNILQATILACCSSKKYLYIQTPYFLPTNSLLNALQTAALSGIDVRLMLSKKSDSPYVDPASKSYYSDLLRAGLRIFEHQTQFIHSKTLVTDDYLSVIGSANMDFRSLETNFEINCYLYDPILAATNREIFMKDLAFCHEILLEDWEKRPWYKRVIESIIRLFAPLF